MATVQLTHEQETRMLEILSAEEDGSWKALVRLMAAELCRHAPKLLAEIVLQRAKQLCERHPTMDLAEQFSAYLAECGLRLTLAEPPTEHDHAQ